MVSSAASIKKGLGDRTARMNHSSTANAPVHRDCIVMSFDSNFFSHGMQCIRTILQYCRYPADICTLALNLKPEELHWLKAQGVNVREGLDSLPRMAGIPLYGYSQICRPFLRELFPGYNIYMWADADIRFAGEEAFDLYFQSARLPQNPVVICQEIDGTYVSVSSPDRVWGYHKMKNDRIQAVYGEKIAEQLRFFYNYNSGIWALHRESTFWDLFKETLVVALQHGFSHMCEQDAMNVAILKWRVLPVGVPATFNWLCSLSLPEYDNERGRFVRPQYPHEPISVLHLITSRSTVEVEGETVSGIHSTGGSDSQNNAANESFIPDPSLSQLCPRSSFAWAAEADRSGGSGFPAQDVSVRRCARAGRLSAESVVPRLVSGGRGADRPQRCPSQDHEGILRLHRQRCSGVRAMDDLSRTKPNAAGDH